MQLRLIFEPSENFRSFFIAGAIPGMALRQMCRNFLHTVTLCFQRRQAEPTAGRTQGVVIH
jgi:hypothetical protein